MKGVLLDYILPDDKTEPCAVYKSQSLNPLYDYTAKEAGFLTDYKPEDYLTWGISYEYFKDTGATQAAFDTMDQEIFKAFEALGKSKLRHTERHKAKPFMPPRLTEPQ